MHYIREGYKHCLREHDGDALGSSHPLVDAHAMKNAFEPPVI